MGERAAGAHIDPPVVDEQPVTEAVAPTGTYGRPGPPIRIDETVIDAPAPRRELSPAEALALAERGARWRDATRPPTTGG